MTVLGRSLFFVSAAAAAVLVTACPSAVIAQSGSRSFGQLQVDQFRANNTVRGNSISGINGIALSQGNAAFNVRNSIINSGLQARPGVRRTNTAAFSAPRSRPVSKPFSTINRTTSVSPYLGLFNENFDPNAVNYNTVVRPLQQQQNITRQLQFQQQQNQRQQLLAQQQQAAVYQRLQEIAAQPAFNPSGSQLLAPTGHSAVFGNTLNFYPSRQ